MPRKTISDLAEAAGVSISTVNRVLGGSGKVRESTMRHVLQAAEEIGFYGVGAIQSRIDSEKPKQNFVVFLQQKGRQFYEDIATHIKFAASDVTDRDINLSIVFMDNLSPDVVAAKLLEEGEGADAIAIVAAEHPLVTDAIEKLDAKGTSVISIVSPLDASVPVGYVGLDNWKVGRTAAWAFDHLCHKPGKIGILVGNHRYRNQELNESGFRSYFRENSSRFTLLEPVSTFEQSAVAHEMVERMLDDEPELVGIFCSGGGITGMISAVKASRRRGEIICVGYELFEQTKAALVDETMTLIISHPFERLAQETIGSMVRATRSRADRGSQRVMLPFDIYTKENL